MSESLRTKVERRRSELQRVLDTLPEGDRTRADVIGALRAVDALTTGDMENIPGAVAKDLVRWLETSKHLGVRSP